MKKLESNKKIGSHKIENRKKLDQMRLILGSNQ